MSVREVKRIVNGYRTEDGAGVKLIRVLSNHEVKDIDPFLMLDAFYSSNPDDYIAGFPMHPHRGIETITYLMEGQIDHEDSLGNAESLYGGQVQWMNSGSGILHQEMPQPAPYLNGLQFWLNLAAKNKMSTPSYFPILEDQMKEIEIPGGKVKLIAGEFEDVVGVVPEYTKANMCDVILGAQVSYHFTVPSGLNTFVYIVEGYAEFGEQKMKGKAHDAVIFEDGDEIWVKAGEQGIHFILLSGEPLQEPVAWAGPIVMNTQEELRTAFKELERGTFIK